MMLMSEEERLETLEILNRSEQEARQMLYKIPISSTTPSILRKKEAIEAKLQEIEDAKKIFSKKKVFIKAD